MEFAIWKPRSVLWFLAWKWHRRYVYLLLHWSLRQVACIISWDALLEKTNIPCIQLNNLPFEFVACEGDQGGPLMAPQNSLQNNNSPFLAGVLSWGYGCGVVEYPAIFVKVGTISAWVHQQTGIWVTTTHDDWMMLGISMDLHFWIWICDFSRDDKIQNKNWFAKRNNCCFLLLFLYINICKRKLVFS